MALGKSFYVIGFRENGIFGSRSDYSNSHKIFKNKNKNKLKILAVEKCSAVKMATSEIFSDVSVLNKKYFL